MNWYELSRRMFDFSFENKECGVYHIAIYMWIVELNNRLWWKEEFWLPSHDTCDWLSIGNKNTYLNALRDLEKWWFIKIIKESRNQFSCTIVSICHIKSDTATDTALDTALIRLSTRHWYAIDTIDKQVNQETSKPRNKETNIVSIETEKKEIQNINEDSETTYQDSMNLLKRNGTKMDNWEQIECPDFTLNYPEEWFKFNSYWTEKDRKGRTRAELQKTFDIKRRFANWVSNKTESKITTKPTICKL